VSAGEIVSNPFPFHTGEYNKAQQEQYISKVSVRNFDAWFGSKHVLKKINVEIKADAVSYHRLIWMRHDDTSQMPQ
jgi:hypothetical protein